MDTSEFGIKRFILVFLCIAFGAHVCSASGTPYIRTASDLRTVAVCFATYLMIGESEEYRPDDFREMEDLLCILAQEVELTATSVLINFADAEHIDGRLPETLGAPNESGQIEFQPEILNFPIGISFSVYPDLDSPVATTPILWTRGLHRFEEFDAPYCGHVAFLDGHVTYFEGKPGEPNEQLQEIFGPESEYSEALRILEHVPPHWKEKGLNPLPVRYAINREPSALAVIALIFGPASIAAALVAMLPQIRIRDRIFRASITFAGILILTLILIPAFTSC